MKSKTETQIKEELSNGLEMWAGRFGEENEYVEFKFPHRRISFVAQKSGENG